MDHYFTMHEDYLILKNYIDKREMFTLKNIFYHISNKLDISYEKIKYRFHKYLSNLPDDEKQIILSDGEGNINYIHFNNNSNIITIKDISDKKVLPNINNNISNNNENIIKEKKIKETIKVKKIEKIKSTKNKIWNILLNQINNDDDKENLENNVNTIANFIKIYIDKFGNENKVIENLENDNILDLSSLLSN